uniref:Chemokine interleukin-8-like domain-containing protein n=1 Tax=Xiphophorus couchianus TaxID=32473 RepID=A0A3B5LIN8_9TELE
MTSIPLISLVLVAVMVPTASAQGGISTCCTKLNGTKVHREMLRIRKIYSWVGLFYICFVFCFFSVIFIIISTTHIFMDGGICASPFNMWTKTSMAFLDGKNFAQRQSGLNKQPNRKGRH